MLSSMVRNGLISDDAIIFMEPLQIEFFDMCKENSLTLNNLFIVLRVQVVRYSNRQKVLFLRHLSS